MNPSRDIVFVDELRALPAETAWLELTGNNSDQQDVGSGSDPGLRDVQHRAFNGDLF